MKMKIIIIHWH